MRNTLICTIGTSLFGNIIRNLKPEHPAHRALTNKNWKQLALELGKEDPMERLCGAEINSIASIVNSGHLDDLIRLTFLVSDTDNAQAIGETLYHYYSKKSNPIQFEQVLPPIRLQGLNDASVEQFQQEGLKNLVRQISHEVRKYGSEAIAINATGGYKAQISFAGMIGQALEIPVYYLFEKFSKAIELPPQPVALDLSLWLDHYDLFDMLAEETVLAKDLIAETDASLLTAMLEEESIDGVPCIALSAMGQLFHERCRLQFRKQETTLLSLVPKTEQKPETKKITLSGSHHGNDVLQKFAEKIRKSPYVRGIVNSVGYQSFQRHPIRKTTQDGIIEFILTWTDTGYGIRIQTTGRNRIEVNTIAAHLERTYKK